MQRSAICDSVFCFAYVLLSQLVPSLRDSIVFLPGSRGLRPGLRLSRPLRGLDSAATRWMRPAEPHPPLAFDIRAPFVAVTFVSRRSQVASQRLVTCSL